MTFVGYLMAPRVLDIREGDALPPGTSIDICRSCGQSVWVSPTGQDVLYNHDGPHPLLVCDVCVEPYLEDAQVIDLEPEEEPPTDEFEDRWTTQAKEEA